MGERVGWIEGTGGDGRKQFWEETDLLVSNFAHGQRVTCPLTFTEIERELWVSRKGQRRRRTSPADSSERGGVLVRVK